MSSKNRKYWILLGTISLLFFTALSNAQEKAKAKIFILHSYSKNHVCGQPQHDGVIAALKENGYVTGKDYALEVYYMNSKKKNNTPELIAEQASIALEKIKQFQPDVLVTLDDNAFRTVALPLVDSDIDIVFCGMNGQPEDYNKQVPSIESVKHPGHNITGIYEKLHIVNAVRVHSHIMTDFQKIRVFVDPSPTGKAIKKQIELEWKDNDLDVQCELKVVETWEEYQEEIIKASADTTVGAIYPIALLLKDKNGKSYTAPEIFSWTTKNSTKPELALNYSFTDLGLFGGAAVDFFAMGKQAGKMVARILNGEQCGSIPIEDATRYALAFNIVRAKQLNIDIPQDILLAADKIVTEESEE